MVPHKLKLYKPKRHLLVVISWAYWSCPISRKQIREHLQARHHQGPALAQYEMGVLHGSVRPRPHPAAEDRHRGSAGVPRQRGKDSGSAHAARVYPQHHQFVGN